MSRSADETGALARMTVVVIEDDADIRRMMERVLSTAGARVMTASSATQAKQLLDRHDFDACVLDLNLGDLGGQALIDHLNLDTSTVAGRVVVVTGSFAPKHPDRSGRAAFGYASVAKPFRPHDLVNALAGLERKEETAALAAAP